MFLVEVNGRQLDSTCCCFVCTTCRAYYFDDYESSVDRPTKVGTALEVTSNESNTSYAEDNILKITGILFTTISLYTRSTAMIISC